MASITEEMRATFIEDGFVVVPGALTHEEIAAARAVVAAMLAEQAPPDGHVGPYSLWPTLNDDHSLLDLYRSTGIGELAAKLLRPGLDVEDPRSRRRRAPSHPGRTGRVVHTWTA